MAKKVFKAVYVVTASFFEALTVSFYKNIKRRWNDDGKDKYMQIKVPRGYKDKKLEPEYKDLSKNNEYSNFSGLPGFGNQ